MQEGLEPQELHTKFDFSLSGKPQLEGFERLAAFSSFSHLELAKVNLWDLDIPFPLLKTREEIYVFERKVDSA